VAKHAFVQKSSFTQGQHGQGLAAMATLPSVVLGRNLEMLDLMLGYEQARQMVLRGPDGLPLLAIAERPGSFFTAMITRQILDSSRALDIDVADIGELAVQGPDNFQPQTGPHL
jgi:hypothetical protein